MKKFKTTQSKPKVKTKKKICTKCKSPIHHKATKCRHCGYNSSFEMNCFRLSFSLAGVSFAMMFLAFAVPVMIVFGLILMAFCA
jgi:ribosomal protein L40E